MATREEQDARDVQRIEMIEAGVPEAVLAKHLVTQDEVWTTSDLQEQFKVLGFAAPFVVVQRKSDGKKGTLMFTHSPRFYFDWQED